MKIKSDHKTIEVFRAIDFCRTVDICVYSMYRIFSKQSRLWASCVQLYGRSVNGFDFFFVLLNVHLLFEVSVILVQFSWNRFQASFRINCAIWWVRQFNLMEHGNRSMNCEKMSFSLNQLKITFPILFL